MIHYHGTPISPVAELLKMKGRHFCVSFADPRDADRCQQIGQSVLFDNGAFSAFTRGHNFDRLGYIEWLRPRLFHPHKAICPDIIGGTEDDQRKALEDWPFPKEMSLPVWHLGLDMFYLAELVDEWPCVAFGSSAEYWKVGSERWCGRVDYAFDILSKHRHLPWVHMLRGLSVASKGRWPFASADSINIGRNFKDRKRCPESMANEIDAIQPRVSSGRREQMDLLVATDASDQPRS